MNAPVLKDVKEPRQLSEIVHECISISDILRGVGNIKKKTWNVSQCKMFQTERKVWGNDYSGKRKQENNTNLKLPLATLV